MSYMSASKVGKGLMATSLAAVACFLLFASVSFARAATLTTDKTDYAPGETATIYGSLFDALQNVVLSIVGQNNDGSTAVTNSWNVQADDQGAFTTRYTLPITFVPLYLVAANGEDGTVLARTTFTDTQHLQGVSAGAQTPNPVTAGNSATYGITANFNGSGTACTANFSVTSSLPTGASVSFSPASVTNPTISSTLTITTTGATPAGSTMFTIEASGSGGCSEVHTTTSTLVVASSIVKTDPILSVTNSPVTYDGAAQAATVVGDVAGTVSNVKYDGSATAPTNAGTYAVTADFAPTDTTHYNALTDAAAGDFVIAPADASCTITGYDVTYDGQDHSATGSCEGVGSDGTLSGLDLSGTKHTNAGTYNDDPWTFTAPNSNYNSITDGTVNDVIEQATVTITASSGTMLQGQAVPAITPSYGSFVNGEDASVLTQVPVCSTTATSASTPGNYPTSCTGAQADNYTFVYEAGTMQVIAWTTAFRGLFNPITSSVKNFQKGSTIPVKFALIGDAGGFNGGDATLRIHDDTSGGWSDASSSGGANTANFFRYDPSGQQYIFNLSTKSDFFKANHAYSFEITMYNTSLVAHQTAAIKLTK
jgi:hypothetical protein